MTFPLPIPDSLRRALPPGTGVLLGISGGVDSAVTLALLRAAAMAAAALARAIVIGTPPGRAAEARAARGAATAMCRAARWNCS